MHKSSENGRGAWVTLRAHPACTYTHTQHLKVGGAGARTQEDFYPTSIILYGNVT
jgi:hypothetical protein